LDSNGLRQTPMTRQRRNPVDDSQEPIDLFRSIRSRIAQRGNAAADDDLSVELFPVAAETVEEPRATPQAPASATPLGMGQVLRGRYVIESQLASGGISTVYMALDRSRSKHVETNASVAIKVLHEQSRGPEVLAKLRREFYGAQALSHRRSTSWMLIRNSRSSPWS
jgi:hypothetical protein